MPARPDTYADGLGGRLRLRPFVHTAPGPMWQASERACAVAGRSPPRPGRASRHLDRQFTVHAYTTIIDVKNACLQLPPSVAARGDGPKLMALAPRAASKPTSRSGLVTVVMLLALTVSAICCAGPGEIFRKLVRRRTRPGPPAQAIASRRSAYKPSTSTSPGSTTAV